MEQFTATVQQSAEAARWRAFDATAAQAALRRALALNRLAP